MKVLNHSTDYIAIKATNREGFALIEALDDYLNRVPDWDTNPGIDTAQRAQLIGETIQALRDALSAVAA